MNATPPQAGAPQPIEFQGLVSCRLDGEGPLGLILIGSTSERPGEVMQLAFAGPAPQGLPETLKDVRVEPLDADRYRIVSNSAQWTVAGVAHLHREIGKIFYEAVPPRAVPWRKRILWRAALRIASSSAAQRLLFRLR